MSASNKTWLMLGGLAVVVFGVVFATKRMQLGSAPRAEILPATLTSETGSQAASRTKFPTILRAKPVTDAEQAASPRYTPHGSSRPIENPYFDRGPATSDVNRYGLSPATVQQPGAESPAFHGSSATNTLDGENLPSAADPDELDVPGGTNPIQGPPVPPGISNRPLRDPASFGTVSDSSRDGSSQRRVPATYTTVADDSFWNISKRIYDGEGRYFKALYYHNRNRIERPDRISAGIELDTPPLAELKRLYPDLCGPGQRD